MGKLKGLAPRIGTLPPRVGMAPRNEQERTQFRADTQHWRSWYGLARWQRMREAVWKRDLYTCQKTGVILVGKYPAPDSPVADHKKPHRGDPALFWDMDNIETVSKAYHDSVKQSREKQQSFGEG